MMRKQGTPIAVWLKALASVPQGQVMLVDLRGSEGSEQEKTRPCAVVSVTPHNLTGAPLVVVPIRSLDVTDEQGRAKTRTLKRYEVELLEGEGELTRRCAAIVSQVRTIDRQARVVELWGQLPAVKVDEIVDALAMLTARPSG